MMQGHGEERAGQMGFWAGSRERKALEARARDLYAAVVQLARRPALYADAGIADTVDGRFEMLVVHLALLLEPADAVRPGLAAALVDLFVLDMDASMRELGVGDLSVGKEVRKAADAFAGRLTSYRNARAPDAPAGAWREALVRNACRGEMPRADVLDRLLALLDEGEAALRAAVAG